MVVEPHFPPIDPTIVAHLLPIVVASPTFLAKNPSFSHPKASSTSSNIASPLSLILSFEVFATAVHLVFFGSPCH